jgi:hypothetical protein
VEATDSFIRALFFSVEVISTIGFGTKDIFFESCVYPCVLVTLSVLLGVLLDAVGVGIVFAHISRATRRASTVILSDKAVLQCVRGQYYFSFQVSVHVRVGMCDAIALSRWPN